MATASKPIAYLHISATPGVRGGRPCIDGTRITVMDIVKLERMGLPPEEMRTHYSSRPLTLAEVHAALTYYITTTKPRPMPASRRIGSGTMGMRSGGTST